MHPSARPFVVAVALVAGIVLPSSAHAAPAGPPSVRVSTAGAAQIFYRSTSEFLEVKRRHPAGYIWTDDGCSVPPALRVSLPALRYASQTFVEQCQQHDFAYRNFGGSLHLDPSEARRTSVDRFFYKQMRDRCHLPDVSRAHRTRRCLVYARVFYLAVRTFGRLSPPGHQAGA